jgi:hypothetical protein
VNHAAVGRQEIDRAAEMLGVAITSAVNEATEVLDVAGWTSVLTKVLAPRRGPQVGEVIDIETLRLIRLARRGAYCGALFADDEGDDAA